MKIKTDEKTKTAVIQYVLCFLRLFHQSLKTTAPSPLISGSLADPLLQNFLAQMEFEKSMDRL